MDLAVAVNNVIKSKGNECCADCGLRKTEWISWNLKIFLCERCARIHEKCFVSQVSKRTEIQWTMEDVQKLMKFDNDTSKSYFEEYVPVWYRTPTQFQEEPEVLLEQWIISKYTHKQFTMPYNTPKLPCSKFGYLMKRGKDNDRYLPRKFHLHESHDTLVYYVDDSENVKAIFSVSKLKVFLSPEKMNRKNSMQLTTELPNNVFRHIYVYHENSKELIDWYMAIRRAKLYYLRRMYPHVAELLLIDKLPIDICKEGKLSKTGSNPRGAFRERWFTLFNKTLLYHNQPMDSSPKGQISLDGATVGLGCKERTTHPQHLMFTIGTENRTYLLLTETATERDDWIQQISMSMNIVNNDF